MFFIHKEYTSKNFFNKASADELFCYAYLKAMDNYFNVDLFNTKPINNNFVTLYKQGVISSIDKGSLLTFNKYSGFTSVGTDNDPDARVYSKSYEKHTTMLVRYDMLNSMQYNNDTQILYGD